MFILTRRRERLLARQVAFNLPLDLAAGLLGRALGGRLGRRERSSRAAWSAFTGYVAIDRDAVDDGTPLFHQVLQAYDRPIHDGNNVLVSLAAAPPPRRAESIRAWYSAFFAGGPRPGLPSRPAACGSTSWPPGRRGGP